MEQGHRRIWYEVVQTLLLNRQEPINSPFIPNNKSEIPAPAPPAMQYAVISQAALVTIGVVQVVAILMDLFKMTVVIVFHDQLS